MKYSACEWKPEYKNLEIRVDGLPVRWCYEADTDAGYAVIQNFDDAGMPMPNSRFPDGPQTYKLYGRVTVEQMADA